VGAVPHRLIHVGVGHAGEMLFKLLSHHPGLLRVGVAAEPAKAGPARLE
jgi:hypothetical protein